MGTGEPCQVGQAAGCLDQKGRGPQGKEQACVELTQEVYRLSGNWACCPGWGRGGGLGYP